MTAEHSPPHPTSSPSDSTPRCRCGHTRHHHMVSAKGQYTLMGWFWVTIMGVTTKPIAIDYICRVCGEKFDHTEDEATLADHA